MISERTAPFQGLRLVGIITIVAAHTGLNFVGGGNWCTFFFLLSGFLYKAEIENWSDYGQYLKRKAIRLYPIYWFCLALYLLLAILRGCKEQYTIGWDFVPHLFLLQSWIPQVPAQAYLGPAWFISSLLFCYCASPIAKEIVEKGFWSICIIVVALLLWNFAGLDNYISPIYRFFEYAIGIWMHRWLCEKDSRREFFPGCNLLLLFAALVVMHFGIGYWMNLVFFLGLIYLIYSFQSPSLQSFLGNSIILNFSKSDIFIYLTHPGIGFHLVFFFLCTNSIAATIGAIIVGYLLFLIYKSTIGRFVAKL